jgi:hypothetical protein
VRRSMSELSVICDDLLEEGHADECSACSWLLDW